MAADGSGMASRFGWLYAVRCAVAFVVTLIAVVVLVSAVAVMLRPQRLQLKVFRGAVLVDRFPSMPPQNITLRIAFTAYNPNDRAYLEISRVNIRLLNNNVSTPEQAKITEFRYPINISLPQQIAQDSLALVFLTPREDVSMSYVQALFDGSSISAEMEVDGLLTDLRRVVSAHSLPITYYCWPVTIAVAGTKLSLLPLLPLLRAHSVDTTCLDKSEAPAL